MSSGSGSGSGAPPSALYLRTDSTNGSLAHSAEYTPQKSAASSASPSNGPESVLSPLASPTTWSQHDARPTDSDRAQYQLASPLNAGSPTDMLSPSSANAAPAASSSSSSSSSASPPASASSAAAANANANANASNILVAIRLRPVSDRERALESGGSIWRTVSTAAGGSIEEVNDLIGKQYHFDYISPADEGTTELYKNLVRKLVLKSCIGYNANVFAYGQTSSGKTYTTLGNEFSPGIVLLAIGDLFHYIAQTPSRQFLLRISCLEIYNEEIHDLLVSAEDRAQGLGQNLKLESLAAINKDGTKNNQSLQGVKIKGLTQEFVRNPAEFIALLLRGEENRKIASTDANLRSSRSHTMFRIHIESRARAPTAAPTPYSTGAAATAPTASPTAATAAASRKIRSSLLTFMDLAGSECISQLGGSLERQKECRFINKSLLGLSRVIVKLSENGGAAAHGGDLSHVPFRDSKVTRILKPALGGNSHTLFICCISPVLSCREESHNTLRFGCFANQVTNVARVNLKEEKEKIDASKTEKELARLRAEMDARRLAEANEIEKARLLNLELKAQLDAAAEAHAETQRKLREEKAARELALKAAAAASAGQASLEAVEQERDHIKLKLRIAEGQIKLLEDKLVPMIEEARVAASDEKRSDESKLKDMQDLVTELRHQNALLESQRDTERAAFEADRRRGEGENSKLLRNLLADKIAEQQRLEARIALEQEQLQQARTQALYAGVDVVKACRNKDKQHVVRLWLTHNDRELHWRGKGIVGAKATKAMRLQDVTHLKLGQHSPAFERPGAAAMRSAAHALRSLSLLTADRSLDLLFSSESSFQTWIEGLKPLLTNGALKIEELRPGVAAQTAAAKRKAEEDDARRIKEQSALAKAAQQAAAQSGLAPLNSSQQAAKNGSSPTNAAPAAAAASSSSSSSSPTAAAPAPAPAAAAASSSSSAAASSPPAAAADGEDTRSFKYFPASATSAPATGSTPINGAQKPPASASGGTAANGDKSSMQDLSLEERKENRA